MGEEKRDRDAEFSFMKEKIKEQPLYRNPWLRRIATAVICGFLFALAAVAVWAFVLPWVRFRTEKQEVKQFELPAEETTVEEDVTETEEETLSAAHAAGKPGREKPCQYCGSQYGYRLV